MTLDGAERKFSSIGDLLASQGYTINQEMERYERSGVIIPFAETVSASGMTVKQFAEKAQVRGWLTFAEEEDGAKIATLLVPDRISTGKLMVAADQTERVTIRPPQVTQVILDECKQWEEQDKSNSALDALKYIMGIPSPAKLLRLYKDGQEIPVEDFPPNVLEYHGEAPQYVPPPLHQAPPLKVALTPCFCSSLNFDLVDLVIHIGPAANMNRAKVRLMDSFGDNFGRSMSRIVTLVQREPTVLTFHVPSDRIYNVGVVGLDDMGDPMTDEGCLLGMRFDPLCKARQVYQFSPRASSSPAEACQEPSDRP